MKNKNKIERKKAQKNRWKAPKVMMVSVSIRSRFVLDDAAGMTRSLRARTAARPGMTSGPLLPPCQVSHLYAQAKVT